MPLSPTDIYQIEKAIWTEADFEQMGWHDVHIHAIAFRPDTYELLLDIDYMFAWVDPEKEETHYTFWMSPCTLVFSNVHTFKADIEWGLGLEISGVECEEIGRPKNADHIQKEKEWKWTFDCQEGVFSFISVGYEQFARAKPIRVKSQKFSWKERGGICFDRITYENKSEQKTGENASRPTV